MKNIYETPSVDIKIFISAHDNICMSSFDGSDIDAELLD